MSFSDYTIMGKKSKIIYLYIIRAVRDFSKVARIQSTHRKINSISIPLKKLENEI